MAVGVGSGNATHLDGARRKLLRVELGEGHEFTAGPMLPHRGRRMLGQAADPEADRSRLVDAEPRCHESIAPDGEARDEDGGLHGGVPNFSLASSFTRGQTETELLALCGRNSREWRRAGGAFCFDDHVRCCLRPA